MRGCGINGQPHASEVGEVIKKGGSSAGYSSMRMNWELLNVLKNYGSRPKAIVELGKEPNKWFACHAIDVRFTLR